MTFSMWCRSLTALFLVSALLALAPSAASAQEIASTELELIVVAEAAVGDNVVITGRLMAGGAPVPEAEIVFSRSARFMNTGNDLEIDRATTDATGKAVVEFSPRTEGEQLVIAEFKGKTALRESFSEIPIMVNPGPRQYSQEAGIGVPGVNVFFLVAVLSAVWGTFAFVMSIIWRIARDGSVASAQQGESNE